MIVPIDRILQNGEIVEILTSSASRGPSRDWLKIVKTSEARNKIRQWFKKEKRTENIQVGRQEFDRELKRGGVVLTEAQRTELLDSICHRLGMNEPDDLFNTIGYGGISMQKVTVKLRDEIEKLSKPEAEPITDISQVQLSGQQTKQNHGTIVVDGVEGCAVKFAKCCSPLPGDKIVGFVTRGFNISIHKADCENLLRMMQDTSQDRFKAARWVTDTAAVQRSVFEASLTISAMDTIGLVADITSVLADMRVNLMQINAQKKTGNDEVIISITVQCKNVEHLSSIISRLRGIRDVESVSRV